MLIIPRTPSPKPLEQRDPGSLSVAEIAELQKQLQAAKLRRVVLHQHCFTNTYRQEQ